MLRLVGISGTGPFGPNLRGGLFISHTEGMDTVDTNNCMKHVRGT